MQQRELDPHRAGEEIDVGRLAGRRHEELLALDAIVVFWLAGGFAQLLRRPQPQRIPANVDEHAPRPEPLCNLRRARARERQEPSDCRERNRTVPRDEPRIQIQRVEPLHEECDLARVNLA